jgi:hypothetical protein
MSRRPRGSRLYLRIRMPRLRRTRSGERCATGFLSPVDILSVQDSISWMVGRRLYLVLRPPLHPLFVFEKSSLTDRGVDKPPAPPTGTGYHRYVFLLLEGNNLNLTAPGERRHWGTGKVGHGVRDWARDEGLEVVGANFFYERHKRQ